MSEASWEALLNVYASHDVSERLAQITAPTLVIGGQHDCVIPVPNTHYLAKHIPGAQLLVLPTGHALDIEAPGRLIDAITGHIVANPSTR